MSSFDEYRRTQVDMLHLVSHMLRLHREPGHWEATPEQRDAYDHIHHSFMDAMHVAYVRLEAVGKAPPGTPAQTVQQQRAMAHTPHSATHKRATRWGSQDKRVRRPAEVQVAAFKRRTPVVDPFGADDPSVHPAPTRLQ